MKQSSAIFTTIVFVVTIVSCGSDTESTVSARQILDEFYAYDGAEDTLMDPLIVHGQLVAPLLLNEIQNSEMPKRRYAIGALGNIGDRRALSVLKDIAADDGEAEYIRCDCVQAIALIDWDAARNLAALFAGVSVKEANSSQQCLPRISERILESSYNDWLENAAIVRSLEDARQRRHN